MFQLMGDEMDFKEIAVDSLRYPFSDWKRFLNLFIFVFLSVIFSQFIIITLLFGLITGGYLIRIIESTLEDSKKLPEFSNMKKLLMDGLRYFIVNIIYGIPVMLTSFLFLGLAPHDATLSMQISEIIFIIVTFLVNIIFLMGLTNMVQEKTISGAFQFKKIFKLIKELGWKNYLIYLLFYTLIITAISYIPTYLSDSLVFVDPIPILMLPGDENVFCAFLEYLIVQGIASTYIMAFDGRLRGLIYPKSNNEDANIDSE